MSDQENMDQTEAQKSSGQLEGSLPPIDASKRASVMMNNSLEEQDVEEQSGEQPEPTENLLDEFPDIKRNENSLEDSQKVMLPQINDSVRHSIGGLSLPGEDAQKQVKEDSFDLKSFGKNTHLSIGHRDKSERESDEQIQSVELAAKRDRSNKLQAVKKKRTLTPKTTKEFKKTVKVQPAEQNEDFKHINSNDSLSLGGDENNDEDYLFTDVEEDGMMGKTFKMFDVVSQNLNPITGLSNLKDGIIDGGAAGISGLHNLGNMIIGNKEEQEEEIKLDTASDNKKSFLKKYGLTFEVPSEYIQKSIFYPKNSDYILQIINYVVPENKPEFQIETHFLDHRPSERKSFTELYQHLITGCALRLVSTNKDLTVMKKHDMFVFEELGNDGEKLRNIDIAFSPCGKYLIVSSIKLDYIKLYDIKDDDVSNIIDDIRDLNYSAKIQVEKNLDDTQDDQDAPTSIGFDNMGYYFYIFSSTRLYIYNYEQIKDDSIECVPVVFNLDLETFECIWDVYFENIDSSLYNCFVGCQYQDKKRIKIFEIKDQDNQEIMKNDENVINFFHEVCGNFKLRFTNKDGKLSVVLANGTENFTLTESQEIENLYVQKNLMQLGDKEVQYISRQNVKTYLDQTIDTESDTTPGFFIVACKEYDEFLHVYKSNDLKFHLTIPRNIQPGSIEVFDLHQDEQILRTLSLKDDQFFVDYLNQKLLLKGEKDHHIKNGQLQDDCQEMNQAYDMESINMKKSLMDASASAFSVGWPYITFTGLKNYLLIYNVFQPNVLNRIQIAPDDVSIQVMDTFITYTKDLFFVVRQEEKYIVYTMNLDNLNTFERKTASMRRASVSQVAKDESNYDFEKVFEYSANEVDYQPLDDFFVRGSSRKEVIQLNQKLIIFILHKGCLYQWTEGVGSSKDGKILRRVVTNQNLAILSRELIVIDSQTFYFCQRSVDKLESISEVVKINVKYNDFEQTVISRENCDLFDYIDFKIDGTRMMLILILRKISQLAEDDPVYLKIVSLKEQNKVIFDSDINDPELKGILKSGHYTLTDGHMYFRNQVIKMRYEMMAESAVSGFTIDEIFNRYVDVLELDENDYIKTKSPMNLIHNHRFAYVILNKQDLIPKRVTMMPYLHERKIYLNRIKKNTQYFYTSIEHCTETAIPDKPLAAPHKSYHHDIIALNISESKYYFYTEKGILQYRVDFSDITKEKGNIQAVSPNGLNFIFQKPGSKRIDIYQLTSAKMLHIKGIEIAKSINSFVKNQNYQNEEYKKLRSRNPKHWLYEDDQNIHYTFKLNNQCDVCIQIRHQQIKKQNVDSMRASTLRYIDMADTLYFFQSGFKMEQKEKQADQDKDDILMVKKMFKETYVKFNEAQEFLTDWDDHTLKGQNLMISNDYSYRNKQFSMDGDRIFFWDSHEIQFYDLRKTLKESNKRIIALQVHKENPNSRIKTVEPGDEQDEIAIVVDQVDGALVFSWSIKDNLEYQVFEVQKNHEILWDHKGKFIIQSDTVTTIPVVGCRLKCFTCDNFENKDSIIKNKELGFQNGYRFDSANHNFMIMYEYICISHSYMTFVIQEEIEKIGPAAVIEEESLLTSAFDPEAFNYLYNRNHVFMRGDLVKNKFVQFDAILKKLKEKDPYYTQILHYNTDVTAIEKDQNLLSIDAVIGGLNAVKNLVIQQDDTVLEKNSALHYAHKIGNNRTVDIILSNMAEIDENNSEHYQSVFPDLIDIKSFNKYIGLLPLATQQMHDKNILRIKAPLNDSIIAINSSPTLYVDDIFYQDVFKEEKNNQKFKAYPVEIVALKIDWIISTQKGKEFLQQLQQSERLDYFEIRTLQIIIEFLYSRSKLIMLYVFLPLYLIQFGFFMLTMLCTELIVLEVDPDTTQIMTPDQLEVFKKVIVWGNQFFTIFMVSIMLKVYTVTGNKYLTRVYTWCDIAFYSLNTITNYFVLQPSENSVKHQRILSSFAILCFLAKTFYYLKLVDQIAPIIDIIIRIVFDIKWFMFVFLISIFAFATSFFLLGNNQLNYDFDSDEEAALDEGITYIYVKGAIWYAWDLCMGAGQGIEGFSAGDATMKNYLYIIFTAFQFIMQIHLLNMLIAYMGETFSKNNEVAEQIKTKDHLSFIIDNWYLKDISLGDVKQIKYIIAALPVSDQNDEDDAVGQVNSQLEELRHQVKLQAIEQSKRNLAQDEMLKMILYNQEKMLHKMMDN